jgi:hypothetical protein
VAGDPGVDEELVLVDQIQPVELGGQRAAAEQHAAGRRVLELLHARAQIWECSRRRSEAVPFAVAAYIASAYWFTALTSFANPAVAIGGVGLLWRELR